MVIFMAYLLIIFWFPFFEANRSLYVLSGILVLMSFSYTDWFFSGIEEFRGITLRSVIIKTISLALLYALIKTEADFKKYLLIVIFSILGNQVLSFAMILRKTNFNFSNPGFRKHLQPLFYLFGATLAASIYTVLDTVLLGFLSNDKAVGLYTASVKLIKLTIPIVTSMGVILIPAISKSFSTNNMPEIKKLLDKSFDFLVFFSIPLAAGLAMLAPELITVFSGKQFISASAAMQILSVLPILIGFGHFFCFQILMPAGKNKEIFLSILSGVFTCVILNFLLVPFLQQTGASIANVVTELVVTLAYWYFIRKYYVFKHNWKFAFQSLGGALLFVPAILLIRALNMSPVFTMIFAVIACSGLYSIIQLYLFKNNFLFTFIAPLKNKFLRQKISENE